MWASTRWTGWSTSRGEITQCDLWFPEPQIPVGSGRQRVLPVLVMTLGVLPVHDRDDDPVAAGRGHPVGDVGADRRVGRVTKTLLWDRESAIGGTGRVSVPAAAFAGTLATQIRLAPPRDPEYKGMVERAQRVPGDLVPARPHVRLAGRTSTTQLAELAARGRTPAPSGRSRAARWTCWRPTTGRCCRCRRSHPPVGLTPPGPARPRLLRASGHRGLLRRPAGDRPVRRRHRLPARGDRVLRRRRSSPGTTGRWAKQVVVTDPAHQATAAQMRQALAEDRRQPSGRHPPPRRRPRRRAAGAAGLRRPVRRRLHPPHQHESEQRVTTTKAKPADQPPKDGLPSMMAYLTRVLKTPTIGAGLGRTRRPGPRRELVARGIPRRASCNARSPTGSPRAPSCGSAPRTSPR